MSIDNTMFSAADGARSCTEQAYRTDSYSWLCAGSRRNGGINECFQDEWEFHPYTRPEFRAFFNVLRRTPAGKMMLLAKVHGQPAGFCWGMPDWTSLFRSLRGKVGPLQIARLIFGAGRYRQAGLIGIGVLPAYRGAGVAQKLAVTLFRTFEERGLEAAWYYSVNETNHGSRRFAEKLGGTGRVLYHCFDKNLK